MAENRTPDDLQEAVAATLRRLRGEVGKTGTGAPAPQPRIEPQLSVQPVSQEIMPAAAGEAPPPAPLVAEPDLLSRAEPEIPPAPTTRPSIRETLASQGREPQAPRGSMRLVPYALSFAAIVVFAGIVWWAYQAVVGGQKGGPVPVITADNTPAKIAPSDQSATDTSGQQQTVYDQISGGTANQPKSEVLLPAPGTPQTPPPPPAPTPSASDVAGTTGGTASGTTTTMGTDTTNTAAATGTTAGTTNTTSTDTSGSTTQTLIPPPAPLAPSTSGSASTGTAGTDTGSTTTTTDAGSLTTTGATTGGTTDTTSTDTGSVTTNASTDAGPAPYEVPTLAPLAGSATTPDVSAPAATTTTTSTDTTTTADAGSTATTGAVADNYHIQLAAVKSQADADKAWKRILAKHTDVLGSLTVHIVRADLGTQGIYYRVQAGPFADKASAQSVCDQLKPSGQQCLVKP